MRLRRQIQQGGSGTFVGQRSESESAVGVGSITRYSGRTVEIRSSTTENEIVEIRSALTLAIAMAQAMTCYEVGFILFLFRFLSSLN